MSTTCESIRGFPRKINMKLLRFPSGLIINPEHIISAAPSSSNPSIVEVSLSDLSKHYVNADEFNDQLGKYANSNAEQRLTELSRGIERLVQGIERLSFRIPSTIRMHM